MNIGLAIALGVAVAVAIGTASGWANGIPCAVAVSVAMMATTSCSWSLPLPIRVSCPAGGGSEAHKAEKSSLGSHRRRVCCQGRTVRSPANLPRSRADRCPDGERQQQLNPAPEQAIGLVKGNGNLCLRPRGGNRRTAHPRRPRPATGLRHALRRPGRHRPLPGPGTCH